VIDAAGSYLLVTAIAALTEHVRSRYADDLELRALTDALTGLWNRRGGTHLIRKEVAASQRRDQRFAFVIFDVDRFKLVNDQYGHATGDRVLIEISTLARSVVRRSDEVIRWGGEEFLILMPETNAQSAAEVAERLRKVVAAYDFSPVDRVFISAGVADVRPGDGDGWECGLKRADDALYRAKAEGRNRVVIDDVAGRSVITADCDQGSPAPLRG
jgi:diguanylate cyclase (GGDEF)-like protein